MSEPFDPYRKWLGIPRSDQPANHYRLLGIERFESDPDVIANAADGRMAQVKNFQAGKYAAASQRILNEIATAKVCLLNPDKKIQYDQQLRQRLETQASAAPVAQGSSGAALSDLPQFEVLDRSHAVGGPGTQEKGQEVSVAGLRCHRGGGDLGRRIGSGGFLDGGRTQGQRCASSTPGDSRDASSAPKPVKADKPDAKKAKPAQPEDARAGKAGGESGTKHSAEKKDRPSAAATESDASNPESPDAKPEPKPEPKVEAKPEPASSRRPTRRRLPPMGIRLRSPPRRKSPRRPRSAAAGRRGQDSRYIQGRVR